MSEHRASVRWSNDGKDFSYEEYCRDHLWEFEGGVQVPASAAPDFLGDAKRVDPEEAFVAAIASCHMLTFLAVAARKRLVVESYSDEAVGTMDKNAEGRLAITKVVLRPEIRFAANATPDAEVIARLHETAHRHCFIANSVTSEVVIDSESDRG